MFTILARCLSRPRKVSLVQQGLQRHQPSPTQCGLCHMTSSSVEDNNSAMHSCARTATQQHLASLARPQLHRPVEHAVRPSHTKDRDVEYMKLALDEARRAAALDEVPVGAVLVDAEGAVVASAHNQTVLRNSPLAHAEMLCLEQAAQRLGAWRLLDTTLYVTCEPCPMCAGAVYTARVKRLVYGTRQPRVGADGSWISMFPPSTGAAVSYDASTDSDGEQAEPVQQAPDLLFPHPYHPDIQVTRGVLQEECANALRTFFRARRKASKAASEASKQAAACDCGTTQEPWASTPG